MYYWGLQELVALSIFVSYFLIIGGLFTLVLRSRPKSAQKDGWPVHVFQLLTLASLGYTWYYMLKYIYGSFFKFHEHRQSLQHETSMERVLLWLKASELFEEAWAAACFGKINWWWSQQICIYTSGAWLVFLWTQGKVHRIKHVWAYMLLGQLVAICVATNLFYVSVLRSREKETEDKDHVRHASPSLVISVLSALALTSYMPSTMHTPSFLPFLLAIHAIIFLPLLPLHRRESNVRAMRLEVLYILVAITSLALQLRTTLAVYDIQFTPSISTLSHFASTDWPRLYRDAYQVLYSHPAQASIGWDVLWTSISLAAWGFIGCGSPPTSWKAISLLNLPVTGAGAAACGIFGQSVAGRKSKTS